MVGVILFAFAGALCADSPVCVGFDLCVDIDLVIAAVCRSEDVNDGGVGNE